MTSISCPRYTAFQMRPFMLKIIQYIKIIEYLIKVLAMVQEVLQSQYTIQF